jgi:N-formylglutamate deformylase
MIFHIPHASTAIPPVIRAGIVLSDEQLAEETLKITDWFTDDLLGSHVEEGDTVLLYPVSRLVVDPERFIVDAQEPMAKVGMGAVYTRASGGDTLRLPPSAEERGFLLDTYYRPHHERLSRAVDEELRINGKAVILDCHSFPSKPLPYENDQNPDRPDICIGTDGYHTPRKALNALKEKCLAEKFSFAENRPFAGSIVPLEHYQKSKNACSIMVEVKRRLYMNEKTGKKSDSFDNCRQLVGRMVAVLRAVMVTDESGVVYER